MPSFLIEEIKPTTDLVANVLESTEVPCIKGILGGKKRRVYKFYRQQTSLLENFQNDSKQIQDFQNKKQQDDVSKEVSLEDSLKKDSTIDSKNIEGNVSTTNLDPENPISPLIDEYLGKNLVPIIEKDLPTKKRKISAKTLALITLSVNIALTLIKALASYLSGSLSIISSLVDSLVDITSGLVIWLTSRAIKKHDPYLYPVGRTRLEPIALVIVSVIMAVASCQMIVQSMESIIKKSIDPHIDLTTICIMITTVCSKIILFFLCNSVNDSSTKVLAQDHRNDCLSNTIALICAFCAQKFWIYLDPIGAIVVSIYIAVTWYKTGKEQLVILSGRAAKPEFINRIIKVCIDHDPRISFIDTVYVYHFGIRFLVEVHIVLDEDMKLRETHDISEKLQNNIECLPEVERAFVHVDYEYEHKPEDEHKLH